MRLQEGPLKLESHPKAHVGTADSPTHHANALHMANSVTLVRSTTTGKIIADQRGR